MTNKQLTQRWFEEVWNCRNSAVIDELLDPEASGLSEGGELKGPAGFRTMHFDPLVAAFPDFRIATDLMVAEGDDVMIRWTVSATHEGEFMTLAGTGKPVRFSGMTWLRFRDGRIIAGADSFNLHGLMALLSTGVQSATVQLG